MKFRGLRRRAPCRRLSGWIAQPWQGPKWKPESAALRSRLLHAYVYRSFVYSRRARGCHRGVKKWVSKCETKGEKLWARTEKVSVPLAQTVPVNLQKKNCACRGDTWTRKQKANKKNNPCRSSKKVLPKRIPNPLKLSIQGHPGEMRQAWLRDGRQPGCSGPSLGNGPRSLPKEKSRSESSRRQILCSYLHASTPTISGHNPKFPARKKLPDFLLSDLFSSTTMTGTDGSRP